jgi:hypothetical protein
MELFQYALSDIDLLGAAKIIRIVFHLFKIEVASLSLNGRICSTTLKIAE